MARQERPVDPTAGPLQSLAYELRKLRVEGGSPTYRVLARQTGYSSSTLSEAASGIRKPTLDVLLAYVGALNGDQDEWRERWEALDDSPHPSSSVSEPAPSPLTSNPAPLPLASHPALSPPGSESAQSPLVSDPAQSPPVSHPAQSPVASLSALGSEPSAPGSGPSVAAGVDRGPGRRWSWLSPRVVMVAGVVLLMVVAAGVLRLVWHPGTAPSAAVSAAAVSAGCPAIARSAAFLARTYGSGTTIRQGPARVERPLATVPAGCTLGLVGYCLGEPIMDATAYTPDVRWFMVGGGGVVASATVHGNPPRGMGLSRCPGDRPLPSAITLQVAPGPGRVTLTASGHGVDVVGYAAYYAGRTDPPGSPSWHQIGLTGPGTGGFAVQWSLDELAGGAKPVVAAAACLGGEGPTGVVDLRAYPAGGAARLGPDQRTAAGQVACLYPVAK